MEILKAHPLMMVDEKDPDQPSASFWTNSKGDSGLTVCTRMRLYSLPSPWAKWAVLWCRLFHRGHRAFGMPSAGAKLWWTIDCLRCGCKYEIVTPHGYKTPWVKFTKNEKRVRDSWLREGAR